MTDDQREQGQQLLDELAVDYVGRPGVDRSAMFGSEALRTRGKVFAFVGTDGELILKLPADRADQLVEQSAAERVQIGRNPAREWIGLSLDRSDLWPDLLEEACRYVTDLHAG